MQREEAAGLREPVYIAIDLKSFYASVECVERHIDPLTSCLVVADSSRTDKTICLAVSPGLKSYGVPGRPRLFEVIQKVREINNERRHKTFGIKAELLIDHAWGWEPCTMGYIKSYVPENNSLSSGQVLQRPYMYDEALVIVIHITSIVSSFLICSKSPCFMDAFSPLTFHDNIRILPPALFQGSKPLSPVKS